MSLFVIGFAWQNVEVMKMKLEFRRLGLSAAELRKRNDLLLYQIERYRRMDVVSGQARAMGCRGINPGDIISVTVDENEGKR
jgi:hypothetical protein